MIKLVFNFADVNFVVVVFWHLMGYTTRPLSYATNNLLKVMNMYYDKLSNLIFRRETFFRCNYNCIKTSQSKMWLLGYPEDS